MIAGRGSPRLGLALALVGFCNFSVGDAVVKSMAGAFPATAASTLRFAFAAAGMGAIIAIVRGRQGFRVPLPGLQMARGLALSIATVCVFLGMQLMPLADATAVQFAAPLITALLSALLLRESAPPVVWLASALAFAGVMVILQPNVLALGPAALFPLGNAAAMACLMLLNRRTAHAAPALEMQFLVTAFGLPVLVAITTIGHFSGWAPVPVPDPLILAKCAFIALTATLSHALIFIATTRAPASLVAPMMYAQILAASTLGWLVFGNRPTAATLFGATLVIAAGLWLWHSQRPGRAATIPAAEVSE